jgi:hypothetical protein
VDSSGGDDVYADSSEVNGDTCVIDEDDIIQGAVQSAPLPPNPQSNVNGCETLWVILQ